MEFLASWNAESIKTIEELMVIVYHKAAGVHEMMSYYDAKEWITGLHAEIAEITEKADIDLENAKRRGNATEDKPAAD